MNIDDTLLERLVPMNALPPGLRTQIRQSAALLEPAAGELLFHEGDRDQALYYVIRGAVELTGGTDFRETVEAGGEAARHPLSPELPRIRSARAMDKTAVLQVNRILLDTCLFWAQATGGDDDTPAADSNDWLIRLAASALFSRVPPENIQKVLTLLEPVHYLAGDTVVRQGEMGDYYYILQQGRCAVSRRTADGSREMRLAELRPGDCFGEEALIAGSRRNATVTMVTDGVLRRLSKGQFTELIRKPVVRELDAAAARELASQPDVRWLDVRLPEEHAKTAIRDSLNIPLAHLRLKMSELQRGHRHIVYCDSGSRSAVATFLLMEHGFEAYHLAGGIMNRGHRETRDREQVLNTARQAQRRRLELARANRTVEEAAQRSAQAAGIAEAAGEALKHGHGEHNGANQALEEALHADQERFRAEARHTEQTLREAQQRRLDLAADTAILERLAEEAISDAESREESLRAAAEERLKAGEERLAAMYQRVCTELERVQEERARFESEATTRREELVAAGRQAESRLAELERQRELAAAEVKRSHAALEQHDQDTAAHRQGLMTTELELRRSSHQKLEDERRRLEQDFAEVAAELEQLQRQRREAAEAQRLATEEAARLEARDSAPSSAAEEPTGPQSPAAPSPLEQERRTLEARTAKAREAYAAAQAELEALLARAADTRATGTLDQAIEEQRQVVSQTREEVDSAETTAERLRITREIIEAGDARSEAIEDTLRRRLERELEEWVARESENEDRNHNVTTRLSEDLIKAQNEALEALKAEEEATANMMDEVRNQLEGLR
ncbi:MAG: cyclic nucleotide-binding domain-containing protein [Gammaproteobacteria bacterium]|nr:cyclic nucleotide-binding domain-containing protein [Gammaproteobacteria bacterium]